MQKNKLGHGTDYQMNKYNNLLNKASCEFDVQMGEHESVSHYKARIVYSIVGRMAMASLFDMPDSGSISITHMKKRIIELISDFKKMYPEITPEIASDEDRFAEELYDIFIKTGCIYHEPNRIVQSAPNSGVLGEVVLTRGYELQKKQRISGLGTYVVGEASRNDFFSFYQLDNHSILRRWDYFTESLSWINFDDSGKVEYLRMNAPYTRGYWVDKPYNNGVISVLRTTGDGTRLYYFYKVSNGELKVSPIPQWMTEDSEYRTISNSCLAHYGELPPTKYYYDGEIVHLRFQYLLPPSELNLIKLYSWPEQMLIIPSDFKRICNTAVFIGIKDLLSRLGYEFVEENYE